MICTLAACSDSDRSSTGASSVPLPVIYGEAQDQLNEGNYQSAIDDFAEVERQYPFSPWATRAKVMAAYAAYKKKEYDQAIGMFERFVKMHPGDQATPYAYYLIGLSYYEQISDVGRDQKMTELALRALTDVVKRFPNSAYARDAKLKLDLTYDHLAGKEMKIGRYYLKQDEYLSAINRFRYVVENYQTTSHVPEALHRLVEGYLRLGIEDEAARYAAVLGHNFPSSAWYKDSYRFLVEKQDVPVDDSILTGWIPEIPEL